MGSHAMLRKTLRPDGMWTFSAALEVVQETEFWAEDLMQKPAEGARLSFVVVAMGG